MTELTNGALWERREQAVARGVDFAAAQAG